MGLPISSLENHTATTPAGPRTRSRKYPWLVFALTFGLLLSDYMSRQVLSAVFPFLETEWALTDSRLASLTSIVALMVGLLTLPLSLLAERWGRVKSLVLMAVLWSVATLMCAVATNFEQMLGARFLVGVGEAAYGSVGIAVVLSVFASALGPVFVGWALDADISLFAICASSLAITVFTSGLATLGLRRV